MTEPARKITPDIEPAIRPDLRVVQGGGQTTPDRASLAELEKQESNPGQVDKNGDLKDKEENAPEQAGWKDKTKEDQGGRQYTDGNGKKHGAKKGFGFMKKKGPMTLLFGGVLGGGSIIAMLSSPALLIVNLKEVVFSKVNPQLTSMEIRTNRKLFNKTSIIVKCSGGNILCRFTTMSDKQIARLNKAGIDVVPDGKAHLLGRTKPKKLLYQGADVDAKAFRKMIINDPEFRLKFKKSYNPKFAGFADNIWKKASSRLKIFSKAKVKINGNTPEAKLGDIQAKVGSGIDDLSVSGNKFNANGDLIDSNGNIIEDVKKSDVTDFNGNKLAKNADDVMRQSDDLIKSGAKSADELAGLAAKQGAKSVTNIIKITSAVDNLCIIYNTVRAVGFAAKTVRAVQLARYAMLFFNIADQIKAGDSPDPEDVSYLGDILTKEAKGAGKVAIRAATDSFGYKYAAYGEYHKSLTSNFTAQFLAGGGLTGDLIYVTSRIKHAIGGSPGETCKTLSNPWVGLASAAIGIAVAIGTGGGSAVLSSIASAGTLLSLGLIAGQIFLPALLADIIAGKVIGEGTFGELAGDAIVSGAGTLAGAPAKFGGGAPLKPEQAAAYVMKSREIAELYAKEDRATLGKFDISSPNTFLGKFVHSLVPYLARANSPATFFQSINNLASSSLRIASGLNISRAVDAEEFRQCEDYDYEEMGIAADPFCNVFYGTPIETLESEDTDPVLVLEWMLSHEGGQIDKDTGEPKEKSAYEDFINKCIEREDPLGYSGDSGKDDDGKGCLFDAKPENKYFYLYHIDNRIENGMSGDDESLNAATEFGHISFYDPADNIDNIADEEHEETSYNDYIDDDEGIEIEVSIPEPTDQICSITSPKGSISPILGWLYGRQNFNQTKQETILS